MSVRTILILALLSAVAVISAAIALGTDRSAALDPRIGTLVFPGLNDRANDVATLKVESSYGVLTLQRAEGNWTLKESDGYPVIPVKANGSILDLATLRFYEPKTARSEKYAKLNLLEFDLPGSGSMRVTVKDNEGAMLAEMLVGNSKFNLPGTKMGGIYLRLPGDQQAWLAAGGLNISGVPGKWLEPLVMHIAGERIKRVEISQPQGPPIVITKRNPQTLVYSLHGVPAGYKVRYDEEPKLIATNLEAFELEDVRRAGAIKFYPMRTVSTLFETFDGLQVTVESTVIDGKYWARFQVTTADGSQANSEAKAIGESTKGWVYRIASYRGERLTKRFESMLAPAN